MMNTENLFTPEQIKEDPILNKYYEEAMKFADKEDEDTCDIFGFAYSMGRKAGEEHGSGQKAVDTFMNDVCNKIRIKSLIATIDDADTDLEGCVWRLFDLASGATRDKVGPVFIQYILKNHLDRFFDDSTMFWEAYKVLIMNGIIETSENLYLTDIGDMVYKAKKLRDESKKS